MRICFLAHEALPFDTRRSLLPIVIVVVVADAQRDMKMPGARARGLVVNIRRCRRRVVDVAPTRHDMIRVEVVAVTRRTMMSCCHV